VIETGADRDGIGSLPRTAAEMARNRSPEWSNRCEVEGAGFAGIEGARPGRLVDSRCRGLARRLARLLGVARIRRGVGRFLGAVIAWGGDDVHLRALAVRSDVADRSSRDTRRQCNRHLLLGLILQAKEARIPKKPPPAQMQGTGKGACGVSKMANAAFARAWASVNRSAARP